MARLIDAQDTFNVLSDYYHHSTHVQHLALQEALNKVPTAHPKHGEWVEYPYCLCYEGALTEYDIACSSCGAVFNVIDNCTETFNYCPNCGAKMLNASALTKDDRKAIDEEIERAWEYAETD
jgi:predicted RNA-binding Zn-ribbon protein involved in translation (DUF1610 family)